MAQRIKGQDVVLQVIQNNTPVAYLSDIRNFELTPKFEKLEEQYLGQYAKKYDEIYHGVDFKFDLHVENGAVLDFIAAVKLRAQSPAANAVSTQFNISAKLNFATNAKNVTLQNCFFEDIPFNFGGRSEYGTITISGSCTDFNVQ